MREICRSCSDEDLSIIYFLNLLLILPARFHQHCKAAIGKQWIKCGENSFFSQEIYKTIVGIAICL